MIVMPLSTQTYRVFSHTLKHASPKNTFYRDSGVQKRW